MTDYTNYGCINFIPVPDRILACRSMGHVTIKSEGPFHNTHQETCPVCKIIWYYDSGD